MYGFTFSGNLRRVQRFGPILHPEITIFLDFHLKRNAKWRPEKTWGNHLSPSHDPFWGHFWGPGGGPRNHQIAKTAKVQEGEEKWVPTVNLMSFAKWNEISTFFASNVISVVPELKGLWSPRYFMSPGSAIGVRTRPTPLRTTFYWKVGEMSNFSLKSGPEGCFLLQMHRIWQFVFFTIPPDVDENGDPIPMLFISKRHFDN